MKEEKTKNEKPKNHIVYFFSFPAFSFGVFMVSISPGNENKKQDSPSLPTEHLHIRCYSPFSLL